MIENGFITTRAMLLRCDERTLRIGLINFLKELETVWEEYTDRHSQEGCEAEAPLLDPWEVADSIFQFAVFGERRDGQWEDYDLESEVESVEEMTDEEIEEELKRFIEKMGGTNEEENND